jgi:MarR family transcriptional regulator, organic hydroperoxide resistance regulator
MIDLMRSQYPHFAAAAAEFDLTAQQAFALKLLSADKPKAMSELAEALHCDASNVTGIVDRLEARGLVARGNAAGDRRIKTLAVTDLGERIYKQLAVRVRKAPPAIAALSESDQKVLRDVLRRALQAASRNFDSGTRVS